MMPVSREKQLAYPHMMPNDIAVWELFLNAYPLRFDRLEYDVHVGVGYGYDEESPDWHVRLAKGLTQYRIDVVGWNSREATIIEVKPYAGLGTLGQLLGYRHFFIKDIHVPTLPHLLAVTDQTTADMRDLLREFGIELAEVGFPPSS